MPGGRRRVMNSYEEENSLQRWRRHAGTFLWSPSRGGFDAPGGTSPAAWPGLTSRAVRGGHFAASYSQNVEAEGDNMK